MSSELVYVGLDVAKATLDVAVRPSGETWTEATDEAGVGQLVARVRALGAALIVCEATGGYERAAAPPWQTRLPARNLRLRSNRFGTFAAVPCLFSLAESNVVCCHCSKSRNI